MKLEILGKPIGKQRPRLGKFGTYTPQKTVNYETLIKYSFAQKYPNFKPYEGELRAEIIATFEVPKSYSKKKKEELLPRSVEIDGLQTGGKGYTHKPDCDNIAKIVLDALNGLAYKDDSQITALLVFKEYGEQAKVIVEVEEC